MMERDGFIAVFTAGRKSDRTESAACGFGNASFGDHRSRRFVRRYADRRISPVADRFGH